MLAKTFWYFYLIILIKIKIIKTTQIIWDNTIDINEIQYERDDIVRMPNLFFIFPGTKWCGAGNIADNYYDFGKYKDTDICCRNHDYCPDIIEGYQTKYNLTNPTFYSRLLCKCDLEFRKCLKKTNSIISKQLGFIYFTALGTQCFKNEYPIINCKKYSFIPQKKCIEYNLDNNQSKLYQWFDVPNY